MSVDLADITYNLGRTPTILRTLLDDGRHPWIRKPYGQDTFSPFDVLGHLIQGELDDWMTRLRTILEHGPNRPFDPFDRYAMYERDRDRSPKELLDQFSELRRQNLEHLQSLDLTATDLAKTGTHPALGTVTARQLLATWVVHDLNHVAQICKALAFQYRDDVGPWLAYLSILRPPNPA